ncbi:MAG: hypothetical protein ACT4OS_12210 [Acidimicrobiales bacterium]
MIAGERLAASVAGRDGAVPPRRILGLVAALSVGVSAGCYNPSPGNSTAESTPTTSSSPAAPPGFMITGVQVDGVPPADAGLIDGAAAGATAVLDAYLNAATVAPVLKGQPPGDLSPVLTAAAAARLAADRGTLFDDELPALVDPVLTATVGLRLLGGPDGRPRVATGTVDVRVIGRSGAELVGMARLGEMVLVDEGGWKIDGWSLQVLRDSRPAGA